MKFYVLLAAVLLSVTVISAQEKPVTAEPVFLGVAQPTVKKLPLPEYPKDAQKAGLGGRVSVAVTVDESGNVTSVDDVTGPYPVCKSVATPNVLALRNAALDAAKKAKFEPAMIESKSVTVNGRIAYIFTPSDSDKSKVWKIAGIGNDDSETGARVDPGNGKATMVMKVDPNYKPPPVDPAAAPAKIGTTESKTISGGVLNGTAMSLPRPTYPAAAQAVHAGGAVRVQVLIYEDGSVYSAQTVSGHPLLRHAAETAACGAGFTPTLLAGQPVKVSGIITYNFVP